MTQLAILGALVLALLVFCVRFMRRGYTTLDEKRKKFMEQIAESEKQVKEDRKRMTSLEHLHILYVALEDLIRLEKDPGAYRLERSGRMVRIGAPAGSWTIELLMREKKLASGSRVLHGAGRWRLTGPASLEEFTDLASLMQVVSAKVRGEADLEGEPEHLARRIAGIHSQARILHR